MKKHTLYITVRIEVESKVTSLSNAIADFETNTRYNFTDTQKVRVLGTQILFTPTFNPLKK